MALGSSPVAFTLPSDIAPVSGKEFLDIHATIEYGFTLKYVRDTIRTYSQRKIDFFSIFTDLPQIINNIL